MKQLSSLGSVMISIALFTACSSSRTIGKFADRELLQQPGLVSGQVGISVYDPASGKFLYNHQQDKYFMPASNTKLFSLYAGLKYLGDSLPSLLVKETDTALLVIPCGDPSLLHPDYARQPAIELLRKSRKPVYVTDFNWRDEPMGRGWAWDDYNDDYAPERSALPVYGNVIRWVQEGKEADKKTQDAQGDNAFAASPSFYSIPEVDWSVKFTPDTERKSFNVQRALHANIFSITEGKEKYKTQDVPFITDGIASALLLLKDTVGRPLVKDNSLFRNAQKGGARPAGFRLVRSQPVDSLYAPMMHRSDNFFAEQTLQMVSFQLLGYMDDHHLIDTLLKTDLKDLPQRPYWVDGSGLSRNDLFTPADFVWLLNKMKDEYGLERLKHILPTGGTGTLANYYRQDSGYVFAKTGSLSGVVALSGYVLTRKGHTLIFSVLVNNHNDPAVRRKIEKLVLFLRNKY